jgi:RES domain
MAPFTHVSLDRPSRFTTGNYGVLYAAEHFETALLETVYHHERLMARTSEPAGWSSQFREILLDIDVVAHDLRGDGDFGDALLPNDYIASQALASILRAGGSEGFVYPSQRHRDGQCVALFYPHLASNPLKGRHLDYHWNGQRVDFYREVGRGDVYRIGAEGA